MLATDIQAFVLSLREVPVATKAAFLWQKGALKLTPTLYTRSSGLTFLLARIHMHQILLNACAHVPLPYSHQHPA